MGKMFFQIIMDNGGWGSRKNSAGSRTALAVYSHWLLVQAFHQLQYHILEFVLILLKEGKLACLALL